MGSEMCIRDSDSSGEVIDIKKNVGSIDLSRLVGNEDSKNPSYVRFDPELTPGILEDTIWTDYHYQLIHPFITWSVPDPTKPFDVVFSIDVEALVEEQSDATNNRLWREYENTHAIGHTAAPTSENQSAIIDSYHQGILEFPELTKIWCAHTNEYEAELAKKEADSAYKIALPRPHIQTHPHLSLIHI